MPDTPATSIGCIYGGADPTYKWSANFGDRQVRRAPRSSSSPRRRNTLEPADRRGGLLVGRTPLAEGMGAGLLHRGNTGALYLRNVATKTSGRPVQNACPGNAANTITSARTRSVAIASCSEAVGSFQAPTSSSARCGVSTPISPRLAYKDAPFPVGIYSGMNMVAGPDGCVYFLGFGAALEARLASGAGAWTQLPSPPAGMLYPNDHQAVVSSCTPFGVDLHHGRCRA